MKSPIHRTAAVPAAPSGPSRASYRGRGPYCAAMVSEVLLYDACVSLSLSVRCLLSHRRRMFHQTDVHCRTSSRSSTAWKTFAWHKVHVAGIDDTHKEAAAVCDKIRLDAFTLTKAMWSARVVCVCVVVGEGGQTRSHLTGRESRAKRLLNLSRR